MSKQYTLDGKPRHIMYSATDQFVNAMSGIMRYPDQHRDYLAEGFDMKKLFQGRQPGYRCVVTLH